MLSNCTQFNLTQQSFTLSCLAGFNGGLDQRFHLELWIKQENLIQTNQDLISNELSPIQNLPTISSISKQSEDSSILMLEKINVKTNKLNDNLLIEEGQDKNLTLSDKSTQSSQFNELSNKNINYSHLLASINLNNLNNQTKNETYQESSSSNNSTSGNLNEKELRKINYSLIRKNSNKLLNMNTLNLNNSETYERLVKRLKMSKFYLMANLTSFDCKF